MDDLSFNDYPEFVFDKDDEDGWQIFDVTGEDIDQKIKENNELWGKFYKEKPEYQGKYTDYDDLRNQIREKFIIAKNNDMLADKEIPDFLPDDEDNDNDWNETNIPTGERDTVEKRRELIKKNRENWQDFFKKYKVDNKLLAKNADEFKIILKAYKNSLRMDEEKMEIEDGTADDDKLTQLIDKKNKWKEEEKGWGAYFEYMITHSEDLKKYSDLKREECIDAGVELGKTLTKNKNCFNTVPQLLLKKSDKDETFSTTLTLYGHNNFVFVENFIYCKNLVRLGKIFYEDRNFDTHEEILQKSQTSHLKFSPLLKSQMNDEIKKNPDQPKWIIRQYQSLVSFYKFAFPLTAVPTASQNSAETNTVPVIQQLAT